jgi:molecular chaperone DnaJ
MPRDYYEVLAVTREADDDEIKKAFRRLARELHPDINRHDPEAENKFKEVAEAYEVLSDHERRAIYDRYGHEGVRSGGWQPQSSGFGNISDIFEAFFGGGDPFGGVFGGRGRGGPERGRDVAVQVSMTLEEVLTGAEKDVQFEVTTHCSRCNGNGAEPGTPIETCPRCEGTGQLQSMARTVFGQVVRTQACDRCGGDGRIAQTPCEQCRGSGREVQARSLKVDIPPGIDDGQRVRLTGHGHAGERGAPAGDLYVLVMVEPDPRFERHGEDLVTRLDVPFTQAALGGSVLVSTLEGEEDVELEPGSQPAKVMRLRGRGLPALRGRGRGDLHLVLNVMIPSHLTDEQRDLLRRFEESANGDTYTSTHDYGLFDRIRQAFRG